MKYIYTLLLIACMNVGIRAADYRDNILYRNITLKESGDSLIMSFDIEVSPNALSKNQSLVIIPRLKSPDGESLIFGYVQINGSQKGKLIRRTESLKKMILMLNGR